MSMMSPPSPLSTTSESRALIEMSGVVRAYQSLRPLRISALNVQASDRLVFSGFDAAAAEMFVYLVTGAAVPDEGYVRVAGRDTRDIATDREWLSSLDRFGIVTHRAILLEGMSVAANLALPLTLSIDPMADDVRERVLREANDVGLAPGRLDQRAGDLTAEERLRVHLARAAAVGPQLVMLEHPTAHLQAPEESVRMGETLRALSEARGFGWIALTEDQAFAQAAGGTRLTLVAATGELKSEKGGWRRWIPFSV